MFVKSAFYTVRGNSCGESCLLKNSFSFTFFRSLNERKTEFRRKKLGKIVNAAFYVWGGKSRRAGFCRVVKITFCVFRGIFHWKKTFSGIFFNWFLEFDWEIFDFWLKKTDNIVKTAFLVSNELPKEQSFLSKNFFSHFEQKAFGLFANKIRHGCQNCFLGIQRDMSKKNNFLWLFL